MEFDLPARVAVLERTPHTFRAMLAGLAPAWTDSDEGPDTWSPRLVLGHLVHGDLTVWIPRARVILAQGPDRRFPPFDRNAQLRDDPTRPLGELRDDSEPTGRENLPPLAGWRLDDERLALQGEHPEFGTVTLRQLLATWVAHDLGHVAQTARVMAKQFREAVGPWREYLAVMDR